MQIKELRLADFRNFNQTSFSPDKSINFILGQNGAGKTSLLEAIHILGFGRSFRTSKIDNIIHQTSESKLCSVFAKYASNDEVEKIIAFQRIKGEGFVFNNDGVKTKKISDIARCMPVQIFTPQSSDLVTDAPLLRRRFIDWLVFHVKQSFADHSSIYAKALTQRNSLLKQFQGKSDVESFKQQDVWCNYLAERGEAINQDRIELLSLLENELNVIYQEFNSKLQIELRYNIGWDKNVSLAEALSLRLSKDLQYGFTSVGPHKADILFLVNGKNASEFLSRGQLRVLVSLLLMAEVRLLKKLKDKKAIFLIDDIGAELDVDAREFFIETAVQSSSQLFVTAIEKQQLDTLSMYKNKKMFHVKQNNVIEE